MIRSHIVYTTSDGTQFTSLDDAELHERAQKIMSSIAEALTRCGYSERYVRGLMRTLSANKGELVAAFDQHNNEDEDHDPYENPLAPDLGAT